MPDVCLETIDTDRPHQTDTPHVVPAGHTQVESALVETRLGGTVDGEDPTTHVVFLETGYRFGLVSHVDLEVLFTHADYVPDRAHFAAPGPLVLRMKLNIVEERHLVPAITVVPVVWVPFSVDQTLRAGGLMFLGGELPLGVELEVNVGLVFPLRGGVLPVVATAMTHRILGRVSGFVDVYATGSDVQLGTGLLWPLTRDVQIDAGTYVGLHGDEYAVTPFIGLSLRR